MSIELFQFEKSPEKKGECPECKAKASFRYYVGIDREFGKCERINECGYFQDPNKEPLKKRKELLGKIPEKKESIEPEIVFPAKAEIEKIISDQTSVFHAKLSDSEKWAITPEHFRRWGVGSAGKFTAFLIANKKNVLNVKKIEYTAEIKRNKDRFPFYLKAPKDKKYIRCLYGLNLLSEDKSKVICLVESEKTAFLAAFYYPQFDWLATGGSNSLTDESISPLFNRKVYYLPDADKAGRKNSTINKLTAYKIDFYMIDLFAERNDGFDLADYLLENYLKSNILPEIKEPEQPKVETGTKIPNSDWEMVEEFISERYELRNNEVANRIESRSKENEDEIFAEINENNIFRELKINYVKFSLGNLKVMLGSDFVEKFNPFSHYFENLKEYDPNLEPDYINNLQTYLPVRQEDRKALEVHFKKMLVRCVACSVGHVVNKQSFILVHDKQNSGKTTFLRWLCPPELNDYIAENIQTDKDSLIAMCTNFIINMDELATLNKTEINALKSVMSKDVFKGRLPYAARETKMTRRANIVGSTNNVEFLSDETGTVRWLCFELTDKINFDYKIDIDINRVWAQAYYLWKKGFKYELTLSEIAENEVRNQKHMITTIEQQLIQSCFLPFNPNVEISDHYFKTATDIKMIMTAKAPFEKTNLNNIGKALKKLGYQKQMKRLTDSEYPIYGYLIYEKEK